MYDDAVWIMSSAKSEASVGAKTVKDALVGSVRSKYWRSEVAMALQSRL